MEGNTKGSCPIVVDAQYSICGRLASHVAKLLLQGNRVIVVNAEKSLISGNRRSVINEWLKKLEISSVVQPKYGPFHPRNPARILTRMIRGMVPRRKNKGREALKRLRVYVGVPKKYESMEKITFEDAKAKKPLSYYVMLSDLASELGWKGG
ncbi:MAG: 50S ribosomal protein L13 [Nitrososphaerota archaeon]|nr:50S ribosomal protein L13 [Nitrososphaerales archaeon]MDW8044402.1 50S ribosomal protein L13 [Nitrososphaerota archaeon]